MEFGFKEPKLRVKINVQFIILHHIFPLKILFHTEHVSLTDSEDSVTRVPRSVRQINPKYQIENTE